MRVRRTALGGRCATHRSLVPRQRLQPIAASCLGSGYGASQSRASAAATRARSIQKNRVTLILALRPSVYAISPLNAGR